MRVYIHIEGETERRRQEHNTRKHSSQNVCVIPRDELTVPARQRKRNAGTGKTRHIGERLCGKVKGRLRNRYRQKCLVSVFRARIIISKSTHTQICTQTHLSMHMHSTMLSVEHKHVFMHMIASTLRAHFFSRFACESSALSLCCVCL